MVGDCFFGGRRQTSRGRDLGTDLYLHGFWDELDAALCRQPIMELVASSADGSKLVAVVNANGVVGASSSQAKIYTSTDSGATWTARENVRNWSSVASSSDGTKLVAGVTNGRLYTSNDSGLDWSAHESNRNWQGVVSSADGTKLVAVSGGAGGRIYVSTDSGASWTPHGINNNWQSVASSADGSKLVAVAPVQTVPLRSSISPLIPGSPGSRARAAEHGFQSLPQPMGVS